MMPNVAAFLSTRPVLVRCYGRERTDASCWWPGLAVAHCLDQRSCSTSGPVNSWMGDRLWAGKPSWYNQPPMPTQPSIPPG